jgi:hypothetical protein
MQLVRSRTAQILASENLLSRQTGQRMTSETIKHLSDDEVNALGFAPDVTLAMKASLAVMRTLQEEIATLQKRLMKCVQLRPDYALLKSMPGVDPVLATTIMLETGTITRFAGVGNFVRTVAAWIADGKATTASKEKATRRMATSALPGRLSKRRTTPFAAARRPGASTSARTAQETEFSQSRP